MAGRRAGYRIWAKGDRCVADWNFRQARVSLARYRGLPYAKPETILHLEEWVRQAEAAVARWELEHLPVSEREVLYDQAKGRA